MRLNSEPLLLSPNPHPPCASGGTTQYEHVNPPTRIFDENRLTITNVYLTNVYLNSNIVTLLPQTMRPSLPKHDLRDPCHRLQPPPPLPPLQQPVIFSDVTNPASSPNIFLLLNLPPNASPLPACLRESISHRWYPLREGDFFSQHRIREKRPDAQRLFALVGGGG